MDVEDLQSAGVIGAVDGDLAIKTARTHQRSIENIRPVGGRHDDDAGVAFKAIHLRQELVEGLLPLVVATAKAGTTLTTNGVDLVNEDDAGGIFLGLLEQIAHTAGTDADEHFDELGAGDREERHTRLTSDCLGQKGLAGAGRTNQQHTFGDLGADGCEAIRILEEVDHLGQLKLGAFDAGNVGESDLGGGLHLNPGLALAELHGGIASTASLGAAEQEEQTTQQQQRKNQTSRRLLPGRSLTRWLYSDIHVVLRQQTQQLLVGGQVDLGSAAIVFHHLSGPAVGGNQHTADLVVLNCFNKIAVAHGPRFLLGVATPEESRSDHHDRQDQQGRQADVAPTLVQGSRRSDEGMLNGFSGIRRRAAPRPRS